MNDTKATLRVWDRLFYNGYCDTTLPFKVALAVLKMCENQILASGDGMEIVATMKRLHLPSEELLKVTYFYDSVHIKDIR